MAIRIRDHNHTEASQTAQPETDEPLEEPKPLSQSVLWSLQRAYFERAGIAAWSAGAVPMWVTSNPFIAAAYARVVRAFLHDWEAGPGGSALDPGQPVYVVELGAGSGRFAYHFLRRLTDATSSDAPGPWSQATERAAPSSMTLDSRSRQRSEPLRLGTGGPRSNMS